MIPKVKLNPVFPALIAANQDPEEKHSLKQKKINELQLIDKILNRAIKEGIIFQTGVNGQKIPVSDENLQDFRAQIRASLLEKDFIHGLTEERLSEIFSEALQGRSRALRKKCIDGIVETMLTKHKEDFCFETDPDGKKTPWSEDFLSEFRILYTANLLEEDSRVEFSLWPKNKFLEIVNATYRQIKEREFQARKAQALRQEAQRLRQVAQEKHQLAQELHQESQRLHQEGEVLGQEIQEMREKANQMKANRETAQAKLAAVAKEKQAMMTKMFYAIFNGNKPLLGGEIQTVFDKYLVNGELTIEKSPQNKSFVRINSMNAVIAYLEDNPLCKKLDFRLFKTEIYDIPTLLEYLKKPVIGTVYFNNNISEEAKLSLSEVVTARNDGLKVQYFPPQESRQKVQPLNPKAAILDESKS